MYQANTAGAAPPAGPDPAEAGMNHEQKKAYRRQKRLAAQRPAAGGGAPAPAGSSNKFQALPAEMVAQMTEYFKRAMGGNMGLGDDVLLGLRNQARTDVKVRERDRLMRRGDEAAARGLSNSGVQERGLQDIESSESANLFNRLLGIDVENSQRSQQNIGQALQGIQGLGQLNIGAGQIDLGYGQLGLGRQELALKKLLGERGLDLDKMRIDLSRELGFGDLGLREKLGMSDIDLRRELGRGNLGLESQRLAMERALQELLQNLAIAQNGYFPGDGAGDGFTGGPGYTPYRPDLFAERQREYP